VCGAGDRSVLSALLGHIRQCLAALRDVALSGDHCSDGTLHTDDST